MNMPKKASRGLDKAIRANRKRQAYYLAGLMGTASWADRFGADLPGPRDIAELSRLGALPERRYFRWGASQSRVALYDPENREHSRIVKAAMGCAEEIAGIMRNHGVAQPGPLTPEELAGIARLSRIEDGYEPVGEISARLPKSVIDAGLPEKDMAALKGEILDCFKWNLGGTLSETKRGKIFLDRADEIDELDDLFWTQAAATGSKFFSDNCIHGVLFERQREIVDAAKLAARRIGLWLRKGMPELEPGFRLSALDMIDIYGGDSGVDPDEDAITIKEELAQKLRTKAIEFFEPVEAEIGLALERRLCLPW